MVREEITSASLSFSLQQLDSSYLESGGGNSIYAVCYLKGVVSYDIVSELFHVDTRAFVW